MKKSPTPLIIGSVVCILFLCCVQILFSIPAPVWWLEAVWKAGDLISFIGTIILGGITVWQTREANNLSHALMDLEIKRDKAENQPFSMIIDYKAYKLNWRDIENTPEHIYIAIGDLKDNSNLVGLFFYFQNTTDYFITLEYIRGHSSKVKLEKHLVNQPNFKLYLKPNQIETIVFYADYSFIKQLKGDITTFEFILENRTATRYKETVDVILTNLLPIPNSTALFCSAYIQNYNVSPCEEETTGDRVDALIKSINKKRKNK